MAYISANYSDAQLGLASAAHHFGLSESYFSQFFKMQTGDTFSGYLERLRIGHAQQKIAGEGGAIEDICRTVGYNSSNTFRRAFKRVTGVAPSEYSAAQNSACADLKQ